jgi:hypothetical protein
MAQVNMDDGVDGLDQMVLMTTIRMVARRV